MDPAPWSVIYNTVFPFWIAISVTWPWLFLVYCVSSAMTCVAQVFWMAHVRIRMGCAEGVWSFFWVVKTGFFLWIILAPYNSEFLGDGYVKEPKRFPSVITWPWYLQRTKYSTSMKIYCVPAVACYNVYLQAKVAKFIKEQGSLRSRVNWYKTRGFFTDSSTRWFI
jgi:hypothetical protein